LIKPNGFFERRLESWAEGFAPAVVGDGHVVFAADSNSPRDVDAGLVEKVMPAEDVLLPRTK